MHARLHVRVHVHARTHACVKNKLPKKSKKKIFYQKNVLDQKKFFVQIIFFDGPKPALLTVTGPIF